MSIFSIIPFLFIQRFYTVLRDCLFSEEENSGLLLDEHSSEPFKVYFDFKKLFTSFIFNLIIRK